MSEDNTGYPRSFAKASFIGRVGSTQFKEVADLSILEISVAVDDSTVKDNVRTTETAWHSISVFGKTAVGLNSFLQKGHLVYVEARIKKRKWTDEQGQNKTSYSFIASSVIVLSSKDNRYTHNKESETIDLKNILNKKKETNSNEEAIMF